MTRLQAGSPGVLEMQIPSMLAAALSQSALSQAGTYIHEKAL